jgi:hypothetical protein
MIGGFVSPSGRAASPGVGAASRGFAASTFRPESGPAASIGIAASTRGVASRTAPESAVPASTGVEASCDPPSGSAMQEAVTGSHVIAAPQLDVAVTHAPAPSHDWVIRDPFWHDGGPHTVAAEMYRQLDPVESICVHTAHGAHV